MSRQDQTQGKKKECSNIFGHNTKKSQETVCAVIVLQPFLHQVKTCLTWTSQNQTTAKTLLYLPFFAFPCVFHHQSLHASPLPFTSCVAAAFQAQAEPWVLLACPSPMQEEMPLVAARMTYVHLPSLLFVVATLVTVLFMAPDK